MADEVQQDRSWTGGCRELVLDLLPRWPGDGIEALNDAGSGSRRAP